MQCYVGNSFAGSHFALVVADTMTILSAFKSCDKYRWHLFVVLFTANTWFLSLVDTVPVDVVSGYRVPDMASTGYSPEQALGWYYALGEGGRKSFAYMALIDLLGIIPSYPLFLGSLLASATTVYPLYYLPAMTCMFDVVETTTHFLAVTLYDRWTPGSWLLIVASLCTQAKGLTLLISLVLVLVFHAIIPLAKRLFGSGIGRLKKD